MPDFNSSKSSIKIDKSLQADLKRQKIVEKSVSSNQSHGRSSGETHQSRNISINDVGQEQRGTIWSIQAMDDNELYDYTPQIVKDFFAGTLDRSAISSYKKVNKSVVNPRFKSLGSFTNDAS